MPRTELKIMRDWEFALVRRCPRSAEEEEEDREKWEDTPCDLPEKLEFKSVKLPHDWAVNMPFDKNMEQGAAQGFRERWGIGWYRRQLQLIEKTPGYLYFLEFGGVYENCTVWVNGVCAGGHKYGYSAFRLDVTDALREGGNTLIVKVDNSVTPVDRWYSGCGIYRTVKLTAVEQKHLEPWDVTVESRISGTTAVVTVDAGQAAEVRGALRETGDNGRTFQAAGSAGRLVFTVPDAKLWSAEEPNLYILTLSLLKEGRVADEIEQRIGIREIVFDAEKGMKVNGTTVKLKGVCLHQEAGCLGIAVTPEVWRERLEHLKKLGCNAIRAAHHTFAVEFLDLCDELGFYVYEECFDKWRGGLYGRYFEREWKRDLEAMVKRDRNRPCIVIWGVGNEVENQAQESMLSILKMLKEYVISLDETRPVSYAMNPHFKRESNVDISKIKDIQQFVDEVSDTEIYDAAERVQKIKKIAEIVDIISCNYQEQWYDLIHETIPDKLILGTEIYEYFQGDYDQMQNFTEENPSLVPFEKDFCIGGFIWTGYDYLGESMGYPAKGWSGALIHTNNIFRPIAYILQSYWSEEPMVHFSVMDYSLWDEGVKEHWDSPIYADHWHFPQFGRTVIPYMIATNCEEAALYLNGKRFYVPGPLECRNRVITGFLPWQPGTVEAVGYRGGKEVCRHVTQTPGPAVALSFDFKVREICCNTADSREEAPYHMLVTVRAVDCAGNPCFRESGRVRFRAEGPVAVLAVDNGDICSNEPYGQDTVHLYHGCASVMLELAGETGRVSVWADGEGLRSAGAVILVCAGADNMRGSVGTIEKNEGEI